MHSHSYHFGINLDRCAGTLDGFSSKLCVPNETKDLNLIFFNMITVINVTQTFTKHTSCYWECKFDGRKYNLNQKWNPQWEQKNIIYVKKIILIGILPHVVVKW